MIYSFDLLDEIFEWCYADAEMRELLNIDTDTEYVLDIANNKLRREYQTDTNIESGDVPFISFYFMHSSKFKKNWLVNVGDLYVDIYAHSMYEAGNIAKRFRELFAENREVMLNYEGQHYSGVNGIYKYRLIYNPLIYGK